MRITRIIAIVSVLLNSTDILAQKKIVGKVDSLLRNRYYSADIDSAYLQRPSKRWSIRLGNNISSSGIEMAAEHKDKEYKAELDADMKESASAKISYSGLSLSISINPASFSGKNTDWGINLNTSGRKMGVDFSASISKTMKGFVNNGRIKNEVRTGDVLQEQVYATGYYVFNSRRFSYAAAFAQSYIQKRSAGSWLLSAAIYSSGITTEKTVTPDSKLNHFNLALGGGYGYNWVPGKGWLLHISGTPTISLYSHSSIEVDGKYEKMKMHFPEFIIIGKGAIIYQHKNWFLGTNMVYYTSVNGEKSTLQTMNTRWYARGFIGYRF